MCRGILKVISSYHFSGKGDKSRKLSPFRPCYGQLGEMRSLVEKKVPVIALTATATLATREVIMNDLCMANCAQIIINPDKQNVKYSVENGRKDTCDNFVWLLELLKSSERQCPRIIVFFRQIKHIAELFEYLQINLGDKQYAEFQNDGNNGYWNRIFAMFHLTTNEKIKRFICSSFQEPNGTVRVVLCSTSFSMGLDVKCVHTVVHFGPANDLDDYLQESGRAGRDPTASCNAIVLRYRHCLNSQNISQTMKEYMKALCCRRLLLLQPFSKDAKSLQPKHECCDNCSLVCQCLCNCIGKCTCISVCSATQSPILESIKTSFTLQENEDSSSSSDEDFSSGSEVEEYIRRKPHVLDSSENDD